MWSTKTGPPTDSQVVAPFVRAFLFPASLGYGNLSHSFASSSVLRSVIPCALGCSRNHDNRVTASTIIVGGLSRSSSFPRVLTQPIYVFPILILSISSSSLVLFLLSLAPLSSSSRILRLPCRMASCSHQIPSSRSVHSGRMVGEVVEEMPINSCPTGDRVSLAHTALFTVLSAQGTLITCRFSWVDGCAADHCVYHCRWEVF